VLQSTMLDTSVAHVLSSCAMRPCGTCALQQEKRFTAHSPTAVKERGRELGPAHACAARGRPDCTPACRLHERSLIPAQLVTGAPVNGRREAATPSRVLCATPSGPG